MKYIKPLFKASMLAVMIAAIQLATVASVQSQTPPPPAPPEEKDAPKIPANNIDLSQVPIPEADKKDDEALTSEELRGPKIGLSLMPVGFVPPPIIYLDKSGMPREKYRNPLEYAPAIYHIKTKKGSIRLLAAQNNLGATNFIPRREAVTIYREAPFEADDSSGADTKDRGPKLIEVGTVGIPKDMTHGMIVITKDPSERYWKKMQLRLVDLSPAKAVTGEAKVINMSLSALGLEQNSQVEKFRPGSIGSHQFELSDRGGFYYSVAASTGNSWKYITRTGMRLRSKEQLLFVAWPVPKSSVVPTGAQVMTLRYRAKDLPVPKAQ
ncbi:hypothetical protein NT6N_34330 [Oceaniferula spumae]|uniref:DUF4198 domain-containing protein n=1 Tax=Oceaniferula spumae TaxID=2979115 RepID=A0AAT9FQY3_9BACT